MAILNLFLDLAYSLQESPNKAVADNLDELFVGSSEFSYVGNRKGLNQLQDLTIERDLVTNSCFYGT